MKEETKKTARHGYRSRSRPRTLVHPSPVEERENSFWSGLPIELLREVLERIEDSEESWPRRKSVVACAGVCTSWRRIVKEIVDAPIVSGKFTFPISLKQPVSRESIIQCFIKSDRARQTFHLYLGLTRALAESGKFLLAASRIRHLTCTDYIISTDPNDIAAENESYVGKLRSNFLGTKFVVYDSAAPHDGAAAPQDGPAAERSRPARLTSKRVLPRVPSGNYPVAHVNYELNVLNSRGPRKMQCIMDTIPASAMKGDVDSLKAATAPLSNSKPDQSDDAEAIILENKAPRWHEQLQCWCLNFKGRVTVASVKNFQLVVSGKCGWDRERVVLQFGKIGKDLFTMDYQYPLSAFQAFALCLSSFDTKIACK